MRTSCNEPIGKEFLYEYKQSDYLYNDEKYSNVGAVTKGAYDL